MSSSPPTSPSSSHHNHRLHCHPSLSQPMQPSSSRHHLHPATTHQKGAFDLKTTTRARSVLKHHKGAFGFDYNSTKGALGSGFGFYNSTKGAFDFDSHQKGAFGCYKHNQHGAFGSSQPTRGALGFSGTQKGALVTDIRQKDEKSSQNGQNRARE
ncbi:hypothetical protein Tco_0734484 [Tanacetum coccineum]